MNTQHNIGYFLSCICNTFSHFKPKRVCQLPNKYKSVNFIVPLTRKVLSVLLSMFCRARLLFTASCASRSQPRLRRAKIDAHLAHRTVLHEVVEGRPPLMEPIHAAARRAQLAP